MKLRLGGCVPVFHHLRGPNDEEAGGIVAALAQDVTLALCHRGYLSESGGEVDAATWLDWRFAQSEQLAAAADASARQRVPRGPFGLMLR